MKNLYLFLRASLFIAGLLGAVAIAQPGLTHAPGQLIVKIQDHIPVKLNPQQLSLNNPNIDAFVKGFQVTGIEPLIKGIPQVPTVNAPDASRLLLLYFPEGTEVASLIDPFMGTGWFEFVELNAIGHGGGVQQTTPDDQFYSNQWYFENDGSYNGIATVDADVDMERAWDYAQGDNTIVACILDSGFKLDHPEVAGRIWTNGGDNNANGNDDDGNGYVDDFQGWDFVNGDNDPTDDHGHGTNVAGILGATGNNQIGYAGVDWNCKLMFGKILNDQNSGFYSWWISAIYYAVDNGADVINMSVGGSSYSQGMENAIDYAHDNGVVVVACMMNFNNSIPYYPATYANTIAVGATDTDDERVQPFFWNANSGSNYGPHIDLCAPGNFINGLAYNSNTNYNSYWGGTSQATPIVAGVASLLKGLDPTLSPDSIRTILRATAQDQVGKSSEDVAGFDNYHGAGRLNAYAAVSWVANSTKVEICSGDSYEGYTASGVYVDYLPNDSVRILDLTVTPQIQTFFEETICEGDNVEGFDTTGIYINIFTASGGCDSVRTLTLTVLDGLDAANAVVDDISSPGSGAINPNVSGGEPPYTYVWSNGANTPTLTSIADTGTYLLTVTDAVGCSKTFSFYVGATQTHIESLESQVSLFPNPAAAGAKLIVEMPSSTPSMDVFYLVDPLGRRTELEGEGRANGEWGLSISSRLTAGIYVVMARSGATTYSLGKLRIE